MEYDCLTIGACCEDCKYNKIYKKEDNINITCDPNKLKKDNITKVGIGITLTIDQWNTLFPNHRIKKKEVNDYG